MSEVTKAVITDETAREILKEMQIANATNRETRDLMSEQAAAMRDMIGKMGSTTGETAASEVFYVPVVYDGSDYSLDGITYEDILEAHDAGMHLILKIVHNAKIYFAALTYYSYMEMSTKIIHSFSFFSKANPDVAEGYYTVSLTTKISDGSSEIAINKSVNGIDASLVVCDVTINGTKYSTVADALNALANG